MVYIYHIVLAQFVLSWLYFNRLFQEEIQRNSNNIPYPILLNVLLNVSRAAAFRPTHLKLFNISYKDRSHWFSFWRCASLDLRFQLVYEMMHSRRENPENECQKPRQRANNMSLPSNHLDRRCFRQVSLPLDLLLILFR